MKIYKAKKKGMIKYLIVAAMALLIIPFLVDKNTFVEKPFILLPLLSPLFIVGWMYFDTWYKIENNNLICRCGFLRGEVEISSINEILKGKTMWSGRKPALATKGLIIKFNKYDEIYIAPENHDEMISDIIKLNSEIKITN